MADYIAHIRCRYDSGHLGSVKHMIRADDIAAAQQRAKNWYSRYQWRHTCRSCKSSLGTGINLRVRTLSDEELEWLNDGERAELEGSSDE